MSDNSLRIEIIDKISTLAAAGFGFVAALAWNDAIQSLFQRFFSSGSGIAAKFIYALVATAAVVVVTTRLGRLSEKLKNK